MTDRELFEMALDALEYASDIELMQQALDALEYASDTTKPEGLNGCECLICKAVPALRKRLAQPEQEPVACVGWFGYDTGLRLWFEANKGDDGAIPLYKDPQQRPWVGLTDEERSELWWNTDMNDMPEHDYGKAIEDKLKKKNT
jgi:hypothetical protein